MCGVKLLDSRQRQAFVDNGCITLYDEMLLPFDFSGASVATFLGVDDCGGGGGGDDDEPDHATADRRTKGASERASERSASRVGRQAGRQPTTGSKLFFKQL